MTKVDVSLKDFFATGKFGSVQLGITREELLGFFGEPDDYGCPVTNIMDAGVWKYGDIEFHFGQGLNELYLIWCDYFPFPGKPCERINLDEWIFADQNLPTREQLTMALQAEGIRFKFFQLDESFTVGLTLHDSTDSQDDIKFEEQKNDGFIVLESCVKIGIGHVVEHLKDNDETRTTADIVVSIGLADPDVFG